MKGLDDAHLVLRADAGKDVDLVGDRHQILIGHLVEFDPGDDTASRPQQADLVGDGAGGDGIVAGDHDSPDARLAGGLHGGRTSGRAGSIMPTRPTKVRSFSMVSALTSAGNWSMCSVGDGQDAQRRLGHRLVGVVDALRIESSMRQMVTLLEGVGTVV